MFLEANTSELKRINVMFFLLLIPMCLFSYTSFPSDSLKSVGDDSLNPDSSRSKSHNLALRHDDGLSDYDSSAKKYIIDSRDPLFSRNQIYRINIGVESGLIFHTNSFLKGNNMESHKYNGYEALNIGYSFQIPENTLKGQIYGSPYQGIGFTKFFLGNNHELGNPMAFYLFQGANIHKYSSRFKFTYEWNFGLSANWLPYDENRNPYNSVIGSRLNAYINAGVFMNYICADGLTIKIGPTISHFSNGNTKYPNAGLNIFGIRASAFYDVNHKDIESKFGNHNSIMIPQFKSFWDYNILAFGSWRRGIVVRDNNKYISDGPYGVAGINFSPMYNVNYRYRVGASLDLVYDGSLGTYVKDTPESDVTEFGKGSFFHSVAVGLSARGEYVMPYFTICAGIGYNIIDSGRDSKGTYQVVALRHFVAKDLFVNIGYKLKDFQNPNFLMLGLGFRFR